eukprot:7751294-Pyramimonas_sp.AAC.1
MRDREEVPRRFGTLLRGGAGGAREKSGLEEQSRLRSHLDAEERSRSRKRGGHPQTLPEDEGSRKGAVTDRA